MNDIWAVDQHDKWLWFGLALHTGIEPFSGHILWMKVWRNNRNPQRILSYICTISKQLKLLVVSDVPCSLFLILNTHLLLPVLVIPMVMQSDPGTENIGIMNTQTMLRQMNDPALQGFVQHRWM